MWFLIPIAGLVIAGIVALASEEEVSARQNWENKYQGAKDEVDQLRRDIERHLGNNRLSYDFYALNDYYYASFRAADSAYQLLTDSRTSLASLKRMIGAANQKRRAIDLQLKGALDREVKAEQIRELRNLTQFRDALQVEFNLVLDQKRDFANAVERLNAQTSNIKAAMRERCGSKGREWYANLENRISSRR